MYCDGFSYRELCVGWVASGNGSNSCHDIGYSCVACRILLAWFNVLTRTSILVIGFDNRRYRGVEVLVDCFSR